MNKLITIIALTLLVTVRQSFAQAAEEPTPPTLAEALKLPNPKVVVFRPTRMGADSSLNFTHIRLGDGSVKLGEQRGVMLLVYSSEGNNALLHHDFHFLTNTGSPVLNFLPFHGRLHAPNAIDAQGRVGIIAILIGVQQNTRTKLFTPATLPPLDTISAEINPDNATLIGLLLPAVQKVREAAAR